MRRIATKTVYEIDGKMFETREKAIDHCEELMLKKFQSLLSDFGIFNDTKYSKITALVEFLCDDKERQKLIDVLSYSIDPEED